MTKFRLPRKLKKRINKLDDNFFYRVIQSLGAEQKENETDEEFNKRIHNYMLKGVNNENH